MSGSSRSSDWHESRDLRSALSQAATPRQMGVRLRSTRTGGGSHSKPFEPEHDVPRPTSGRFLPTSRSSAGGATRNTSTTSTPRCKPMTTSTARISSRRSVARRTDDGSCRAGDPAVGHCLSRADRGQFALREEQPNDRVLADRLPWCMLSPLVEWLSAGARPLEGHHE